MKKANVSCVDPFFGSGISQRMEGGRLAPTWFFLKPQVGNTTPAACLPFGMVSACAYSGGYPTGYGTFDQNYHSVPAPLYDCQLAAGFTHFHVSGTGNIGHFYNYFRVIPSANKEVPAWQLEEILDEQAQPGCYSAELKKSAIRAELTVSEKAAVHRYGFPESSHPAIAIDFASGGLATKNGAIRPDEAEVRVIDDTTAQGWIYVRGVRIYIHAELPSAVGCSLWSEGSAIPGEELRLTGGDPSPSSYGVVFDLGVGCREADVRLGFSMRSCEQARTALAPIEKLTFDEVAARALAEWSRVCDLIEVCGGTEEERGIFYSSLYQSFVKPSDWTDESPFYSQPRDYYSDFATLWDQYKTQLPLVFSLMPERGSGIVRSLLALGEFLGRFPNASLLGDDWSCCSAQARALAHHVIIDGFHRKLEGVNWQEALDFMVRDLRDGRNADFLERGEAVPAQHNLDLAGACHGLSAVASALGHHALADEMKRLSANWRSVYDPATGILKPSEYYEGGAWNYSFRLLPDMAARIGLHPTEEAFVADLEKFFGYGQPPVRQPFDPHDSDYADAGVSLNRFEGLNNEPDMETPYAFLYAGRPDRTAEVVREVMRYNFTPGRGGLPGNNDSGGLTSWYVWSASGLFPVPGQPLILIGSPIFDEVRWKIGAKHLTVRAENNSSRHIYVQHATWNGAPHDRAWLSMEEFLGGGELVLTMGAAPTAWAKENRPGLF